MRLLTLALICTVVVTAPVRASRVLRLSLTDIRDRAAAVVVVEVVDASARVGFRDMVWTDYRVRIVEVLRGDEERSGQLVTLSFAGGRAGGLDVGIAGVPVLELGARYAIFLDPAAARPVPVIGWGQGLFRIRGNALVSADGEQLDVDADGRIGRRREPSAHPRSGSRLADPVALNGDGSPAPRTAPRATSPEAPHGIRAATLDDLRRFVRGAAAERRERTAAR